jgi:energy-converting hydrogenase Eha subunit E
MTENDDLKKEKELAFYTSMVEAWIQTRFEHDKSLLTLSAGAIGLLLTLISTVGVSSIENLILHVLALLSFIICLASLLAIFKRNAVHLENVVHNREAFDPLLNILDKTAISTFMAGVIFSSIIGISTAVTKYIEKEKTMSEK